MLRHIFRAIRRGALWALLVLIMLFGLQYSTYPLGVRYNAVAALARDHLFDYVTWEIEAVAAKAGQTLFGVHPYLDEAERSQFVRDYLADLAAVQGIEAQIDGMYADPTLTDPAAASADLRQQRDALRADLEQRQLLAEAILEGQVAAVLADEGFAVLGQVLPPVAMRFTRLPNRIVISPRDAISYDMVIDVDPLPVDQKNTLEAAIDVTQDVSSLVVPLGGMALYPAMIAETASLAWAVEVFAHEWLHHYLYFFPLGLEADANPEARIINETTANLFGKAIVPRVLARYYPDLAREGDVIRVAYEATPFDFGAEMDETRRRVDELLAAGEVEAAEAYMEERRIVFYENGYLIRKLNQAYFAFYGGYQSGAPGAGGADPIGPAVQAIKDGSPSLQAWIVSMRTITTRDQLLATQTGPDPVADA